MLALSTTTGLVIAGVGLLVFLLAALYLVTRGGWRTPSEEREITAPPTMQPGPSDADLDTKILERFQGWGIVLVLFFAIWIPIYGLAQPSANEKNQAALLTQSIERGHNITLPNDEAVNPGGVGCVNCHGMNLQGGEALYQGKPFPVPPLYNVCAGAAGGHPLITSEQDLINTIEQGRPGTPMPSWSVLYSGAMDDQQIMDVVNYLISVNEKNVPYAQNVCINPKAGSPTPAPTASGSPAASSGSPAASPTP